jgi:hypothetical protein
MSERKDGGDSHETCYLPLQADMKKRLYKRKQRSQPRVQQVGAEPHPRPEQQKNTQYPPYQPGLNYTPIHRINTASRIFKEPISAQ